jgi:hypothetical protein
LHRWDGKYVCFCSTFVPSYQKVKRQKNGLANTKDKDDAVICPLGHASDAEIHDAISHLRILDGSLPEHANHGSPVNFLAAMRKQTYWVKDIPMFGFFYYYTLDKVVFSHLAAIFDMSIWHPANETEVNAIFDSQVKVCILQLH